jgi:hypothetical protein
MPLVLRLGGLTDGGAEFRKGRILASLTYGLASEMVYPWRLDNLETKS